MYQRNKCSTLLLQLENETGKIKWDVIGISEVTKKNEDLTELNVDNIQSYQGNPSCRTRGVGFLKQEMENQNQGCDKYLRHIILRN